MVPHHGLKNSIPDFRLAIICLVAFTFTFIKIPTMVFFLAFLLIADAKPVDEVPTLVYVRTLLKWILTGAVYIRIRRSNPNLTRQTLSCLTICKAIRVHFSH